MRTSAYIFGLIFIAVLAVVIFSSRLSTSTTDTTQDVEALREVSSFIARGVYDSAVDRVENDPSLRDTPWEQRYAQGLEDTARFMTGVIDEQLVAVRSTKDAYQNATDDIERAINVNRLLDFLMQSKSQEVFNEIFTGEPFAQYRAGNDFIASMHNLARHSFTLNPTSVALWYIAQWNIGHLVDIDVARSASSEDKEQHTRSLLNILDQAEILYETELATRSADVFALSAPARYWFWRGYTLGTLARTDNTYLPEAELAYNRLVDHYDTVRDENGDRYPFLESFLPPMYMLYALDVLAVEGDARREDAQRFLATLMRLVADNPQRHRGFTTSLRHVALGTSLTHDFTYANLKILSEVYEPFESFIADYGIIVQ